MTPREDGGRSAHLITIEPTGVYDTVALKDIIGGALWESIAPRLPRLCKGRVLGEDVLDALRTARDRDTRRRTVDLPVERVAMQPNKHKHVSTDGCDKGRLEIRDDRVHGKPSRTSGKGRH